MKTIDLLVQELPALGGFPDGAVEAGFLCSNDTLYFVNKDGDCPSKWRISMNYEVEDRWVEVTREQYESALTAKNDGWIEWGGGECPVGASEMVDVIFGYGGIMSTNIADCWRWNHSGTDSDIIAYRLHQPQQAEQPEESEEDLNECIGQDVDMPEWNGEGLPPVGCECEWHDANVGWLPVTIKYISEQIVVMESPTIFCGVHELTEIAKDIICDKPQFRPLRTEADKKREAILDAIYGALTRAEREHNRSDEAEAVYEAIAAGKIPGVKLED